VCSYSLSPAIHHNIIICIEVKRQSNQRIRNNRIINFDKITCEMGIGHVKMRRKNVSGQTKYFIPVEAGIVRDH
jgi:hypothetical protein